MKGIFDLMTREEGNTDKSILGGLFTNNPQGCACRCSCGRLRDVETRSPSFVVLNTFNNLNNPQKSNVMHNNFQRQNYFRAS